MERQCSLGDRPTVYLVENTISAIWHFICQVKCVQEKDFYLVQTAEIKSSELGEFKSHLENFVLKLRQIESNKTLTVSNKSDESKVIREQKDVEISGESAKISSSESAVNSSGESAINSSGECAMISAINSSSESVINSSSEFAKISSSESAVNRSGECAINSSGESAINSSGECAMVSAINSSSESAKISSSESVVNSSGECAMISAINSSSESAINSSSESAKISSSESAVNSSGECAMISAINSSSESVINSSSESVINSSSESVINSSSESVINSSSESVINSSSESVINSSSESVINSSSESAIDSCVPKKESCKLIDNSVQIRANKSEIDRRIAAYMSQKQEEVNEFNKREFSVGRASECESCARTESVFIPRTGSRSHIKISKVVNLFGPQTQLPCTSQSETESQTAKKDISISSSIEDRIRDVECHINMSNNSTNIICRLKAIEERILFLESLSPEYFNQIPPRKYRKYKPEDRMMMDNNIRSDGLSLTEIDSNIQMLQESLQKKQYLSRT